MIRSQAPSKRILIVEDEPDVATYLEALLQDSGYETFLAANGRQGLEAAKAKKPDLIVLDLVMPGQTGHDLYRNLRKDKGLAHVPVIVVSAVVGRQRVIAKAAAVFDKPIDPKAFIEAVAKALA